MSLTNVKADGNVPFQKNRPRYSIVGVNPSTIIQRLATGDFTGKRATTAAQPDAALLDPEVSGGKALWDQLALGGVFFLGGDGGRPLLIESVYAHGCTPTYKIVSNTDAALETAPTSLRPWPTSFPIRLGKGECVCVTSTGGTTLAEVGFNVRLDGQKVL